MRRAVGSPVTAVTVAASSQRSGYGSRRSTRTSCEGQSSECARSSTPCRRWACSSWSSRSQRLWRTSPGSSSAAARRNSAVTRVRRRRFVTDRLVLRLSPRVVDRQRHLARQRCVVGDGGRGNRGRSADAAGIRSFPVQRRPALRSAINEYVHSVVEDEFSTMRHGRPSERTATSLDDLYATYQSIQGQGGRVGQGRGRSDQPADAVAERRRARLGLIPTGLPGLLLGFLIVGSVVFVALLYPATMANGLTRALISGATAAVIAFRHRLEIVLDYPFYDFCGRRTGPTRSERWRSS